MYRSASRNPVDPVHKMDRCSEPGRSGHRTDERNRDRIGHCFCGELEFGLCLERSRLIPVLDSQVVRQDPEKAIVFGSNLRLRRRRRLNTEVALQAKLLM